MGFKADLKAAINANFTAPRKARVVAAFASAYNYQTTIDGLPNPQAAFDFAAERIADYIQQIVQAEEQKAAHLAVSTPAAVPID